MATPAHPASTGVQSGAAHSGACRPRTGQPPAQPPARGERSGTGPITAVHVSLTGEGEWHEAEVEPAAGPHQWQNWTFKWDANDPGRHSLRARATDAAGNVQPDIPPWNRLGYGNNAIEVQYVDVI